MITNPPRPRNFFNANFPNEFNSNCLRVVKQNLYRTQRERLLNFLFSYNVSVPPHSSELINYVITKFLLMTYKRISMPFSSPFTRYCCCHSLYTFIHLNDAVSIIKRNANQLREAEVNYREIRIHAFPSRLHIPLGKSFLEGIGWTWDCSLQKYKRSRKKNDFLRSNYAMEVMLYKYLKILVFKWNLFDKL